MPKLKNRLEVFTNGLRFTYNGQEVQVFNAEGTHNYIASFKSEIDTKRDLEVAASWFIYENNA